ncbi:Glucan endo-1,3-beta-glucosidase 10 [Triticum urartu]|uniref:Glucan endo-1,3-beta-glucosidase 10 n=1 Tax=Triticum urartu TaxID=4572 RepID=M7ZRJ3_TRIUA|nr:Glucan endo-1,3-beta-glucosidase 10 [Triticum urartu]
MPLLLLLLVLLLPAAPEATPSALLGINYGRVGNNLPPTTSALQLLAGLGVGRVRLYDADPATLRSFANTGVELIVGVPDECLAAVPTPSGASAWVRSVIQPALPATKIAVLTVGNEVLTGANSSALTPSLLPAMQCIHDALAQLGLDKQVAVTTAHNLGVLATSYRPSSAYFRKDLLPVLCPILDFHARTGSPFPVNAYPYFAYAEDPAGVELDPHGTPVYELAYRLPKDNATTSSGAGGTGSITGSGRGGGPQNNGYYSISASSAKANVPQGLVDMDTSNHASICGCPVDDDSILILSNFQVVLTWKDMCAWKEGSLWCLKWSQGVPLVS